MPRYIEKITVDPAGIVDTTTLPVPLPYSLTPRDFLRMVEDVHDVLYNINAMLHSKGYQRMEELLDPAGFSGMVSRTVATRLAATSRTLVVNGFHNGYPDLLVGGQYPKNAKQHGAGGLEVKASRYDASWQTHGPREGWFCVVQFQIDVRESVALHDREPTRIRACLVADLSLDDWNWQPAKEGKIRSGTASMKASGLAKCRRGAVWVDPLYEKAHKALRDKAVRDAFRDQAATLVEQAMRHHDKAITLDELTAALVPLSDLGEDLVRKRAKSKISSLIKKGRVKRIARGGPWELIAPPEPDIQTAVAGTEANDEDQPDTLA